MNDARMDREHGKLSARLVYPVSYLILQAAAFLVLYFSDQMSVLFFADQNQNSRIIIDVQVPATWPPSTR
jgi:hypothetical protein